MASGLTMFSLRIATRSMPISAAAASISRSTT